MTAPETKPNSLNGAPTPPPTAEELRVEIAQTRAALASTTEALAERLDVPSRVKARLRRANPLRGGRPRDGRPRGGVLQDRGTLAAAAIAVVGAVVAVWAWRHRR